MINLETTLSTAEHDLETTLRLIDDWSAVVEDPSLPPPERTNAESYLRRLNTLASHQRTELAELRRKLRQEAAHAD